MIALTKEKREELIKFIELRKSFCADDSFMKDVYSIALSSLTAERVPMDWAGDDHFDYSSWSKQGDGIPLFTAPPVPEINFGSDDDCEEGLKKHGLRTRSHGPSQLSDGFRCGFAWREHIIKRLNGLGE